MTSLYRGGPFNDRSPQIVDHQIRILQVEIPMCRIRLSERGWYNFAKRLVSDDTRGNRLCRCNKNASLGVVRVLLPFLIVSSCWWHFYLNNAVRTVRYISTTSSTVKVSETEANTCVTTKLRTIYKRNHSRTGN